MGKKIIALFLATLVLASVHLAQAQQAKVYRVGVIHEGGPSYVVVDGLKEGLRDLGFEEGKHFLLEIRDVKGRSESRGGSGEESGTGESQLDIRGCHVPFDGREASDNRGADRVRCWEGSGCRWPSRELRETRGAPHGRPLSVG